MRLFRHHLTLARCPFFNRAEFAINKRFIDAFGKLKKHCADAPLKRLVKRPCACMVGVGMLAIARFCLLNCAGVIVTSLIALDLVGFLY